MDCLAPVTMSKNNRVSVQTLEAADKGVFEAVHHGKQTVEEIGETGSFSSISDSKNNIHWLVANTERAYTFDVIVHGLNEKPTEIDNIDMYDAARLNSDILKVKKMKVADALKKYGKSHH